MSSFELTPETSCNVITCNLSKLQLRMWSVVYCKVLAVCTAVRHLYRARARATWRGSTAHARSTPYISPALVCTTQGQTQGAYSHHSLLGYTLASSQITTHTYVYTTTVKASNDSCIVAYTPCAPRWYIAKLL